MTLQVEKYWDRNVWCEKALKKYDMSLDREKKPRKIIKTNEVRLTCYVSDAYLLGLLTIGKIINMHAQMIASSSLIFFNNFKYCQYFFRIMR